MVSSGKSKLERVACIDIDECSSKSMLLSSFGGCRFESWCGHYSFQCLYCIVCPLISSHFLYFNKCKSIAVSLFLKLYKLTLLTFITASIELMVAFDLAQMILKRVDSYSQKSEQITLLCSLQLGCRIDQVTLKRINTSVRMQNRSVYVEARDYLQLGG